MVQLFTENGAIFCPDFGVFPISNVNSILIFNYVILFLLHLEMAFKYDFLNKNLI